MKKIFLNLVFRNAFILMNISNILSPVFAVYHQKMLSFGLVRNPGSTEKDDAPLNMFQKG